LAGLFWKGISSGEIVLEETTLEEFAWVIFFLSTS
jgi:hypothetical protein